MIIFLASHAFWIIYEYKRRDVIFLSVKNVHTYVQKRGLVLISFSSIQIIFCCVYKPLKK